ncbi:hypothetical protein Cgig2_010422 [Carnegiea gigantea]|uniref:Uncharacterized protein n=1 Tax=Carnegiea gigantea TaxID=171969 RepID=A0A9Q1K3P2_9CARY|nr:hypothetical protein Cgig2_010422 [Carnegiea gigantea]
MKTGTGLVSVAIYGDPDKLALMNLILKDCSCVQKHYLCFSTTSAYNISPLLGTRLVPTLLNLICLFCFAYIYDGPSLLVDDLADQILEVLNYFELGAVMRTGVTAGAYISTLFAIKYKERVRGLILIAPLYRAPSSTEWLYNKWLDQQESANVMQFLGAINRGPDITEELKKWRYCLLMVVGEDSSFHAKALHMDMKLDRRFSASVKVS